tara:strand:- start:1732 stop:3570 length:1839 start_codon:yes stop_codon:yes gene_type:complete
MADTKNYGLKGVGANIELGKRGNTIESNSGNVILKTTAGALATIAGANGSASSHFVTKAQLDAKAADSADGFQISLGDVTQHGDGSYSGGAITLTDSTKISSAIDTLNETLGLLVPTAPGDFPNSETLTVSSVGSSPYLAGGTVPDRTSGGTLPASAGASVTRVTDTTPNSSQIDNFRSDSGTLAAVVNGSTSGSVTFDGTDKNATYTDLRVSGYADSPSDTPGFYTESDAQIRIASALSTGWNRIQMTKTDTDNTNEVYFVVDDITSNPAVASGTISGDSAGSSAYSSGIEHFASGGTVTVSNLTMTNLAGETYRNGDPISISGSDSIIGSQSYSYSDVGVSTPITRQTTSAQSLSALTVNINGSNRHTSGSLTVTGTNVNGSGSQSPSGTILLKAGTARSTDVDEQTISKPSGASGGNRVYLGSSATGDTPLGAGNLPSSSLTWDSTQDLTASGYAHEAAVVGGIMSSDQTDYTSGYWPDGNAIDYSGKDAAQYFTFYWAKSAVSTFSISITGTYSGLYIGLPGVSDSNSTSPNATGGAWYDAFTLYDGSGNPGGTGNGAGCGNGAVASGSSGSVAITLGTESTTNATNNVVLVRVKLGSSNSISAISVS